MKTLANILVTLCAIIAAILLYFELTNGRLWFYIYSSFVIAIPIVFIILILCFLSDHSDKLSLINSFPMKIVVLCLFCFSIGSVIFSIHVFQKKEIINGSDLRVSGFIAPGQIIAVQIKKFSVSGYFAFKGVLNMLSDDNNLIKSYRFDESDGITWRKTPKSIIGGIGGATTKNKSITLGKTFEIPSHLKKPIKIEVNGDLKFLVGHGNKSYTERIIHINESLDIPLNQSDMMSRLPVSFFLILIPVLSILSAAIVFSLNIILKTP